MRRFVFLILFCGSFTAFSQGKLTPELMWKLGRVSEIQLSPDGNTILYGVTFYDLAANKGNRDLYTIPVNGGTPVKLTDFEGGDFNALWRPDGKKIGYLTSSSGEVQLWEMKLDGSDKKQITSYPGGINGFSYAPDMKHILVIRDVKLDQTPNEKYSDLPLADARIIDDLMYRHWDSWDDYSYSHIFIAPYDDGKLQEAKDIMEGEKYDTPLQPFGGMEQINWSPDGSMVAYTCKKLKGLDYSISTNSDIYIYNLSTGKTEDVSRDNEGYDMEPVFSPDNKMLVWASMKTPGFESDKSRIILMDLQTRKQLDLSVNFDQSSSTFKWGPAESNQLYFISGIKATFQVYKVDVQTKVISQLTTGVHDFTELCIGTKVIVGAQMSMSAPTEIYKIEMNGNKATEKQITYTNKEILAGTTMGKVEERWITTSDNKKMLTWIIYPPNFDKTKKYPALLYCQGGPQDAVSQFWSYRWNFQIMAANGYIIVAPNRRGLPSFGQEWNDEISEDYGGQDMQDYFSAIDSVAKDPWVDSQHLGAVGASYGAYSVYWLAGHNTNHRFSAFIAHCGMFNFESWYASTEEYWFPDHDFGGEFWRIPKPKSYDFSPSKFVGNWDTPILVIHGGNDFRIPYTEGIQAFNAAQVKGVPSRFLFFPNESHFILKPQNAVLWQREFFRWLDQWLKSN
jgi:dipeptidyl aminopeptidase/acylaminoacyl peptidase